jgi:hypothetical protein
MLLPYATPVIFKLIAALIFDGDHVTPSVEVEITPPLGILPTATNFPPYATAFISPPEKALTL